MQKNLWRVALLGLLLASPVCAADTEGNYVVSGPGNWACQETIQKATEPIWDAMLIGWVGGYLTASTYHLDATYRIPMDAVEASTWILEYCRRNPVANVSTAAETLLWSIYPHRLQTKPAVSLPPLPAPRPVVPDLPQWDQPRPQKTLPVKRPRRS